jgi:hypothetical protein
MSKYKVIADGGHAWLSVPLAEIKELGVADQISSYSYMTHERVFLEEDCDAGVFLEAAGLDIDSLPYSYSDNAKCRSYASYDPRWVHEPLRIGSRVWVWDSRWKQGTVTHIRWGHYIVEGEEQLSQAGTIRPFKYGIPSDNPLRYCTPA